MSRPNPAILLAPPGALLLFAGVAGVAWSLLSRRGPPGRDPTG